MIMLINQSTNDVFPTAMHISVAMETISKLLPSLKLLENSLKRKSMEFKNIVKIAEHICKTLLPYFRTRIFRIS